VKSRRDQIAERTANEIRRLHEELWGKRSLEKAIRIGELLMRERKYQQGEWLVWLGFNFQFSHDTALRYMKYFEGRDELKAAGITTLDGAYRYLFEQRVKRLKSTGGGGKLRNDSLGESSTRTDSSADVESVESGEPSREERKSIFDEISAHELAKQQRKIQEDDIHQRLAVTLEEVAGLGQVSGEFMQRLIGHSKVLDAQRDRLHALFQEQKRREREQSKRFLRERRSRE
jgi:hypothetical protein